MDISLLSDELKTVIKDLVKAEFEKQLSAKDSLIAQQQEEIAYLNQQIDWFRKKYFGSKSEKTIYIDPNQKKLFSSKAEDNNLLDESPGQATEEKTTHVPAHDRKARRSRKEIYDKLPHEEEIIDLPESDIAPRGGSDGTAGKESEVEHTHAQCRDGHGHGRAYGDRDRARRRSGHHSQEHVDRSAGCAGGQGQAKRERRHYRSFFPLSRTVMANWVITVSELYLEKIYLRLCKLIVQQPVIHADETPIQVLHEPGRRAQQKSYMWVYATSKRAKIQIRCFSYENSRSGERANRFLKDFNGILISDGYGGYLKVEVIRAGCWTHMRRKWVEAMPKGVPSESSTAAIGLKYCTQLFEFERRIENLSNEERAIERQKIHVKGDNKPDEEQEPPSAKEILQEYWKWIDSLGATTGKLKTAVTYALNQKQYLETFLDHGDIEISNNQVENAIRPFVVGRKGWLFSDTPQGARASAVIYSLIETAKANNIKPAEWLEHVLLVSSDRFAHVPNYDVDDLLPWSDEMQTKFKLK